MTTSVEYTARVQEAKLTDGSVVYVGSIEELEGIYTQATTRETALADLFALVQDLHDRLGLPVVGLKTDFVAGWSWEMPVPGGSVRKFEARADLVSIMKEPIGTFGPSPAGLGTA